jgi:hypothetical protein
MFNSKCDKLTDIDIEINKANEFFVNIGSGLQFPVISIEEYNEISTSQTSCESIFILEPIIEETLLFTMK